jgi:hypothetical protein
MASYFIIMKKRFFISLILLLIYFFVKSQTFEILLASDEDDIAYDAIKFTDGFLILYTYGEFYPSNKNFNLLQYNIDGDFVDTYSYPIPEDFYFYETFRLLEISDGFIIFGNGASISTSIPHNYILKLNTDLTFNKDTICQSNPYNSLDIISEVKLNSNNDIVVSGIISNQESNSFIETFNSNLELAQRKEYAIPYILSSFLEYDNYYYLFDGNYPYFFKCNKDNFVIIDSIGRPAQFSLRNAIKNPFGSDIILAGRSYFELPQDPAFTHLSEDGETINHWIYDLHFDTIYAYSNACTSFIDSATFYMAGTYNVHENVNSGIYDQPSWIMVNKLKTDGTIIWQKYFKGEVAYMPQKLLATEDGGALILSTKYDWNNPILLQRDLHILKIDSTGWYDGITNLPEYNQPKQILIYPNPFHDNINIALGLYHNLDLEIYDHNGKLIDQYHIDHSKSLNLSHLPAGAYVYRFIKDGELLESGKLIKE